MARRDRKPKLVAIMFTDMVGYSAMTNQNEELGLDLLKKHQTLLRQTFPKFEGKEINAIADSFIPGFGRGGRALRRCLAIQEGLATQNTANSWVADVRLRIG